jgi:hypothetical protein
VLGALASSGSALAQVAPECDGIEKPDDYDENVQEDFLQNYVALATTYSPVHGPVPHESGHGSIGIDVGIIPPVGCDKRFALAHTKTEDPNKAPAVPRLKISGALPQIGPLVPYLSLAYLPPVKLLGTTNVIVSGEAGLGATAGEHFQAGGRYHMTLQKTVGEVVTPFAEGDPVYDDLYLASSFGIDALAGWKFGSVVPYVTVGFTDVSSNVYIGDDGVVANNLHPYAGLVDSLGVDSLIAKKLRLGGELYAAWGGHSVVDDTVTTVKPAGRYGHIYTARINIGYEF